MANQVAYGFINMESLFDRRITQVDVNEMTTAIEATLAEHNRQLGAVMGLFVNPTLLYKERFRGIATSRLQPMTEEDLPLPVKPAGLYDVAYPIHMAGTAWGATYLATVRMTVAEVNEMTITMQMADIRWMRDHLLAALLTNVDYAFTDEKYGALTVKPLANNDAGYSYQIISGADTGANDTHFLAQAAVIATATDPIPAMIAELNEHPENSDDVVIFVPTSNRAAVEGLARFLPIVDPYVIQGSAADRININLEQHGLNLPNGTALPGELFGRHTSGAWLAEWKYLPADYLIGVTVGGERPVAMRQDPEPELQGFRLVAQDTTYPFYRKTWMRRAGFGIRNRVGAVVQRVGNGAYAIPTNFAVPQV